MSKRIGVVIPARNEASTVGRIVHDCSAVTKHVWVIDDASNDATALAAADAGARVIKCRHHLGVGGALRRGLRHASALELDAVAILDADGAHDPTLLDGMSHHHFKAGASLTIGSRFVDVRTAASIPSTKRAANRLACIIINAVLNTTFSDVASGMRMFDRDAIRIAIACRGQGFGFMYQHLAVIERRGLVVTEYPISVRYDAAELLATSRRELQALLRSIADFGVPLSPDLASALSTLRRLIQRYEPVFVAGERDRIIGHPMKSHAAYLFQQQDPFFAQLREDDCWIKVANTPLRS